MKLPRVQRIKRGGRVLCYHRPTKTRLPDLPETHPEFVAAWAAAEALARPAPKAKAGSIDAAIISALSHRRFRTFSGAYQSVMRREIDAIRASYAGLPISGLRQHHIRADLKPLAHSATNHRLKAWRYLCTCAVDAGLIATDPSNGIKKVKASTEGHARWSADDVAAFRERWKIGTVARACFELVYWTGARTADAVRMGRQHVDSAGVLIFRQSKTGGAAHVPWTAPLPHFARDWEDDRQSMHDALRCLSGGLTYL